MAKSMTKYENEGGGGLYCYKLGFLKGKEVLVVFNTRNNWFKNRRFSIKYEKIHGPWNCYFAGQWISGISGGRCTTN
jgi:hypothetical protein